MVAPDTHSLSNIDPAERRGDCAICGSVALYVVRDRVAERFRCSTAVKQRTQRRKRANGSVPMNEKRSRQHALSDIDAARQTANCTICGPTVIRPSYSARGVGYRCRNLDRAQRIGRTPMYWRRFRYGLAEAQFRALLASQNDRCAICRRPIADGAGQSAVHVDHCHSTGRVRGLLCPACNTGLGRFSDDPMLLLAAIWYLTAGTSITAGVATENSRIGSSAPTVRCSA